MCSICAFTDRSSINSHNVFKRIDLCSIEPDDLKIKDIKPNGHLKLGDRKQSKAKRNKNVSFYNLFRLDHRVSCIQRYNMV